MNSKSVYRKKRVGSCLALCLIGAVMSSTMSIPAWAAPASGTAKDDNTVVRDAIKGTPVGSLNANQEVKVRRNLRMDIPGIRSVLTGMVRRQKAGCVVI